jgi:hypothetical protein
MRTLMYGLVLIAVCFSCKKDDKSNNPVIHSASCESATAIDMTGAVLFGDGTSASCTEAKLQELLNNGGKIKFNGGTQPYTLVITKTLELDAYKETILDGGGLLTISGGQLVRIFHRIGSKDQTTGVLFAVQNLKLIDGKTDDGLGGAAVAIGAYGSFKAINVEFTDNIGPLSNSDACGAVHTVMQKEVVFSNCIFSGNKAANGGAVGTIGSAETFINCTFDNNEATGNGGTSTQGGSGGAVYMDGADQNGVNNFITFCGCTFTNNRSGYQAGAVNIIFYDKKGSYCVIDKCEFENNSCSIDKGGACYLMNGDFTVTASTFANNSSPASGGAIWTYNTTPFILTNCTFYQNKAVDLTGIQGLGGAISITGQNTSILHCTFSGNQSGDFASAIFNGGKITLTNTLFYNNAVKDGMTGNPDGGAVINKSSDLTVKKGNLQFPAQFTSRYGTRDDYWLTSNVLTDNPILLTLSANGGPTKTCALQEGSPAIDKGDPGSTTSTDQRGRQRSGAPDIGAYEFSK